MIITQLTLHNFGVYAGTNQFQFQNRKPVILIGGMNGQGKTTFLEAVLLALYGSNSYAYTESRFRAYGQYLKSYVNKSDGSFFTYIELTFKIAVQTEERYTIRREWTGHGQRVQEKIAVQKNGADNAFLTEHWSMFIESIFPSGLSNFFFFDGEKIAELAVEETSAKMKDSIRALLGITVLDRLESDLGRIVANIGKTSASKFDSEELDKLRTKKRQADTNLQHIDEEIAALERQLAASQKTLANTNHTYSAKGGDLVSQRQELFCKRSEIAAKIQQLIGDLVNQASGELPLCLIQDLLEEIDVQAEKEYEQRTAKSALVRVEAMSAQFLSHFQTEGSSVEHFVEFIKSNTEQSHTEPVYNLSEQAWQQVKFLKGHQLKKTRGSVSKTIKQLEELQAKVGEIDSYLSIDIDEKALARIYKQIKTLEQTEIELQVQLEAGRKKRAALHSEALHANTEYNRYIESTLNQLELQDDSDRMITYAQKAVDLLGKYRVRLQENKVNLLARTMTDCYQKLSSKKCLIDHIHVDPVTLDFQYINAEGEIIPKISLSAGEKQLMVIALLWSLAICSKWKLPVIIDTPLSRLDSAHRLALITVYFPHASEQTIILSTDSEIDEYYYSTMKQSIGDEFTLAYDDKKRCSTIKKGYFTGGKHDHKAD